MTKTYDPNNVRVVFGGLEINGLSIPESICGPAYIIKDLSNYPKYHPDYSETEVLVDAYPYSFKLKKDSESHKYLESIPLKERHNIKIEGSFGYV